MQHVRHEIRREERGEGFTLVELVLVIVILGILAAVVVASFSNVGQNAAINSCKASIKTIRTAAEQNYAATNNAYVQVHSAAVQPQVTVDALTDMKVQLADYQLTSISDGVVPAGKIGTFAAAGTDAPSLSFGIKIAPGATTQDRPVVSGTYRSGATTVACE